MKIKSLQTGCVENIKQADETGREEQVIKQTNEELVAHSGSREQFRAGSVHAVLADQGRLV